jgi:proton-dependent oligopeptide transporter, POT family
MIAIAIAVLGHVVLTIAAWPSMLQHTQMAFTIFVIGSVIFGSGTGGIKPNISPLIAEQIVHDKPRISMDAKTGERVIIDPDQTAAKIYNWFYLFINVGALFGQISMSYAALYVGYYLAFLLPTLLFLLCPLILALNKKNYKLTPPQGSVLGPAVSFLVFSIRPYWSWNPLSTINNLRRTTTFWDDAKPSRIPSGKRPRWMTPKIDDAWVSELRQGFEACSVLFWLPLYWLTYNKMNNDLTSQADTMQHKGVPPEIVSNLDPLALIILIPICDLVIYPFLRKRRIPLTPIRKTTLGFWVGASAMLYAALLQHYIYTHNDCGYHPSEGLPGTDQDCPPASISIIYQAPIYIMIAISEILVSITSMEYAFTKAPKNMRSMVQAFALLMGALANLIGEGFLWLAHDPLLVWNYALMGLIAFVAGGAFWYCNRGLDWENEGFVEMAQEGTASDYRPGNLEAGGPAKDRRAHSDTSWDDLEDSSEDDQETQLRDRLHREMTGHLINGIDS